MKTVRAACQLQDNALSINVSDQIEQLDELINAEGEGSAFYEKTHITAGMHDLLAGGLGRLAGKSTTAVFHLKQAMGGGKTHLLVGIGLVAKHPALRKKRCADIPHVGSFGAARVAAFNGRNNPPEFFWGEIAKQLGDEKIFGPYWTNGPKAPDEGAWVNLLKSDQPTLILLDELPPYFQYYGTQTVGKGTVADIVTRAFANLLVAASKLKNVCVVVSDLQVSYGEGASMIDRALTDARNELGRAEKTITPVDLAGNEIYEILRKRLFKKMPDQSVIDDVAAKYGQALAEAAKSKTVSRGAEALADEIAQTYPFHPRLKNLVALFKENEQFKQTRGLMELVSRLLKSVWDNEEDVYLIGAQHFDLGIPEVREKLAEISGMRDVIAKDLWDANNSGHAQIIDAGIGSRAAAHVGSLLLTASLSTAVNAVKGLTVEEILECLVTPLQGAEDFRAAFEALENSAWYLHHTLELKYYFDRQENLTKLLQSLAEDAPDNQVESLVKDRLEKLFTPERKAAYVKVIALPKLDEVIDEVRNNRVLLIVTPDSKLPPEAVRQFFDALTEKNNVLVLTGEKTQMASVEKAARNVYAALKADSRIPKTHAQREEYEQKQQGFEHSFTATVTSIFDKVMFPFQRTNQSAQLKDKTLVLTRDAKAPFKGEDQVEKTLIADPIKLYLDVDKDFDGLRDRAEDLLWPEGQVDARWSDVIDRAQQKPGMSWLPPKGLDSLKAIAINRGLWADLGNGYVTKKPAKKKTAVQVTAETEPDDNGAVRLRVNAINAGPAPRVHYAEDGIVSDKSPVLTDDTLTTKALRVQFLAIDPNGQFETGESTSWETHLTIRSNLREKSGKRLLELKVAPKGSLKYTLDGREPRHGDGYSGPFDIGDGEVSVLVFAEADGLEAKETFKFRAVGGGGGPVIDDAAPATFNAAGGGKRIGSREDAYTVARFVKERGVRLEKVMVNIGQASKSASVTVGEVEIGGQYLEDMLNKLAELFEPTAPLVLSIGRGHFATGHDLKEFAKLAQIVLLPTEVSQ